MTRPAPSPQQIAEVAAEINRHAMRGRYVQLPFQAVDQLYTAIPGAPGEGIRILQEALHPLMRLRTLQRSGDLQFWIDRQTSPGQGAAA